LLKEKFHMIHRSIPLLTALIALSITGRAQERIDLAGPWERWIGGKLHDVVQVPSSYRPIGTVVLRRNVTLPAARPKRRILLRFEGVTHRGVVRVNGGESGTMGPWTPYDFDITGQAQPGSNRVEVELTDWQVPLGPIGAWEAYGGIIRPAAIEMRPDPYIENAHLQYRLNPVLDNAACDLTVHVRSARAARGHLQAELIKGANVVATATREVSLENGATPVALTWALASPDLWSPETPYLYTLRVRLRSDAGEDLYATQTGFRELRIDGNKFYLNGKNLVLHGVCRHDIWKDQGHTITAEQIEQDLRMIKAMGANFVRLVHYPHNWRVVDAAARIGLLVTEESGLVWLNFRDLSRETIETGLGNLERTIRRDWNNPALFAVLLANESSPTLEVIQEGRKRVRALAPDLLMSSARVDGPEHTLESSKRLFDEGGLDFYTDHPYGYDMDMFEKSVSGYSGKPVVFTEWGGRAIGQSPILMRETTDQIGRLVEAGRLAGYSFWSWADLPEWSRQDSEMESGILKSGVVSEDRSPRPDVYLALMDLYRRSPREPLAPGRDATFIRPVTAPLSAGSRFSAVSLQPAVDDREQARAWAELESLMQEFFKRQGFTSRHWQESGGRFWLWNSPQFRLGDIPFSTPLRAGKTEPVVLTPGRPKVEIPVGIPADRLHIVGNVTLPDGYPVIGRFAARVGRNVIVYADGERQDIPLRWGMEIARSNMISVASRIDPATADGERVVVYAKDPIRELHQSLLLVIPAKGKQIAKLICELNADPEIGTPPPGSMHHSATERLGPEKQSLVIFAVTAEQAARGASASGR
jgi:hypothetical protein